MYKLKLRQIGTSVGVVLPKEALAALKQAGFRDAVHLQGGVLAWIKQVDPSLPDY